jgi:hypothetical protein
MAHERAEADAELDALAALGALASFASYVIKSISISLKRISKSFACGSILERRGL